MEKIVEARLVPGAKSEIKPLAIKRDWMDETPEKHAYNCFPMTLANGMGWGLSFKEDVSFIWDGVWDTTAAHVKVIKGKGLIHPDRGNGTISFNTGVNFKTDENTSIVTIPTPNLFIPGFHVFTTIISSSWFPHELPAAARITIPNVEITIPAGTQFLTVLPISIQDINNTVLKYGTLSHTVEEEREFKEYGDYSQVLNRKGEWTNFYRNATNHKGESKGNHEIKAFRLRTIDNNGK